MSFTSQSQAQSSVAQAPRVPFNVIVSERTKPITQNVLNAVEQSGGYVVRVDTVTQKITEYYDFGSKA